ncbi:hypothetical protein LTR64_004705 [Lithohypha guttulata]|uniref:uncharacterized protein n=1 Tax=Lithohypha guttulata TaxID=1690604 RepID=UPI002DE05140|nr:hypothetical protein LTR51_005997 [Lithohypha guttulata]
MSKIDSYFGDDSDADSDNYDPSSTVLPFPKPLDRSAFLVPTFNAADFLSSLTSRFQTLEDLQTELQDLLKSLNKELVDLVNDNYTDFLSLGEKLRGGEEKIAEVRVGLLGFQRDVTGVRNLVDERSKDIRALLERKRSLGRDIRTGRTLLEIDERLEGLEVRLDVSKPVGEPPFVLVNGQTEAEDEYVGSFRGWTDEWTKEEDAEFSDEDEGHSDAVVPPRLNRNLQQLQVIQALSSRCGDQHPFVLAQHDRMAQIRDLLRKDLESAILSHTDVKAKQKLIQIRAQLDGE